MDALKSAGRAIIRTPGIAKQSWGSGKHKKLPENWTDTREMLLEGMTFHLKYLGMTLVDQPKGEELSAAAVKRIVATAKASGKKLQKVILQVSPRGIILYDSLTNDLIENVSIYRISYCTADKFQDKVFAYIAQSQRNDNLECHAFLCTKRKVAQAVTLTVAQAFKVAFEFWQVAREGKEKRVQSGSDGEGASSSQSEGSAGSFQSEGSASIQSFKGATTGNLLDIEDSTNANPSLSVFAACTNTSLSVFSAGSKDLEELFIVDNSVDNNNVVWELDDGLDEAFSRLAESRTNPQLLDTGVSNEDYQTEECLSPTNWEKTDLNATERDDFFGL